MKNINKINDNRYFIILSQFPLIKKERFLQSHECFIDVIDNWNKILGDLIIMAPSEQERIVIIENLYNKHGYGDINKTNTNIVINLLKSLGYDKEIKLYNVNLPTHRIISKFNELLYHSTNVSWIYSIATLAMIEYVFIDVNTNIYNYTKNFLLEEINNNYNQYKTDDDHQYIKLINLLIPYITTSQSYMDEIISGLNFGYNIVNNLYTDLSYFLCIQSTKKK